jgi:hypothetical protein
MSIEFKKNVILDYNKHIDDSIKSKCERIFDAMGWDIQELEYGGNLLDF